MTSTTPADPTLDALVPLPSRRRNAVVLVLALLALVAAAWLGAAVRLDLRPSAGGAELLPDGRIAYTASLDGRSFPGVRVTDLRPPEGTRTASVWVLGPDDPDPLADATSLSDAVATMQASDNPGALPQPVSGDVRLLVLLEVEDCAALTDGAQPRTGVYPPILEVRSLFGSVSQVDLDSFTWPAADLEAAGACG